MIRGKKLIVKNDNQLNIDFNASIHNRFDIEVVNAETGEVKQTAVAYNTLTNYFWNQFFDSNASYSYIAYGNGTREPSLTDTNLSGYLGHGSTTDLGINYNSQEGWVSKKLLYQLPAGSAVGKVISEVGLARAANSSGVSGYLISHALLRDMNGNIITIEKTDRDVINFYATVFLHYNPNGYNNIFIPPLDVYRQDQDNRDNSILISLFSGCSWDLKASYANTTYLDANYGGSPNGRASTYKYAITSLSSPVKDLTNKTISWRVRLEANSAYVGGLFYGVICRNYTSGYSGSCVMFILDTDCGFYPDGSLVKNEAVATGDGATKDYKLLFPFPRDVEIKKDGVVVSPSEYTVDCKRCVDSVNTYKNIHYMKFLSKYATPDFLMRSLDTTYWAYAYYNVGQSKVMYNRLWEEGISQINNLYIGGSASCQLCVSDDMENWVQIGDAMPSGYRSFVIPEEHQYKKFWRLKNVGTARGPIGFQSSDSYVNNAIVPVNPSDGYHIHFNNPPEAGSVITATYRTPSIAKDSNHVFDVNITLTFSEMIE